MKKRKTPEGDGNLASFLLSNPPFDFCFMKKIKTPAGEGNFISPISFWVNLVCIMKKIKTPRGDDKFLSGFSSGFYSRLKKQKTPAGDAKYNLRSFI